MKPRASSFLHGANVMFCLVLLTSAVVGVSGVGAALVPPLPPWVLVVISLVSVRWSVKGLRRQPEELVMIRRVCANCEPDKARGAF